jgi:ribulose-phosphate 3-epimerase
MSLQERAQGVEVEPSLYTADFANLGAQIEQLIDAGTRIFHFDVGDGHFVEPVTMGPIVLESIAPLIHGGRALVDCHLMVAEPERHIPQVAAAGADSVTFHLEAVEDPSRAIAQARSLGLGVGVAFNPVQVDGGIDETNAVEVAEAGARLIVSGSAIFDEPDIARAYESLRDDVDANSPEPELKGTR